MCDACTPHKKAKTLQITNTFILVHQLDICFSPAIECPPLSDPENGWMIYADRQVGSEASFTCAEAFHADGPNTTLLCMNDGQWHGNLSPCIGGWKACK